MNIPNIFKKDPDKSFILNYAPIFAHLNFLDKNLILQKSKVVEYKKGDIIYKQHSPPDAFYCVITGRVRITSGLTKKETLEYLNCGKYFGMISVLTGEPHSVNAEAANDSKILKIELQDFQAILNKIPKLAIDLSQTLSRRLRKKDIQEKKIFESNILSVFGAVKGIGRTMYAMNLGLSLKKETGKNVILIAVGPKADAIKLNTSLPSDSLIKNAVLKDQASGIGILNVSLDKENGLYAHSLNAILTHLTADYHYIIVDLPASMDEIVFGALSQSDTIHLLTDYDVSNLEKTKSLISELFKKVNYPQEKIKVIINARVGGKCLPYEEVSKILDYRIYAMLPIFWPADQDFASPLSRVVLEEPDTEYARAVRRIARELGDVRVGLALSGGAAFGLAHIGVIKVLEKEKIPVDMVVGSSIGALIGALWAAGFNGQALEKIVLEFNNNKKKVWRLLFDPGLPKLSFAKGKRIRSFLEKHLGKKTFEDIKFPFKVVACNLSKRQEVIFDSGSLVDAVMASIAIPGVFAPTKINSDLLVDGGIIEPVSISILVKAGIKKIVAVNVLPSPENIIQGYELNRQRIFEEKKEAEAKGFFAKINYNLRMRFHKIFFPNIMDIMVNSIQTMEYVIAEADCQRADVVLRPVIAGVDWFEFFKAQALIKKGEEEALKSLALIKSVINENSI